MELDCLFLSFGRTRNRPIQIRIVGALLVLSTMATAVAGGPPREHGIAESVPKERSGEAPSTQEDVAVWGNQLFVVPRDWLPAGYSRSSDSADLDPFRFRTGAEFRAKADAYQREVLKKRAGIDGAYAALSESRKQAIESLIDARRGDHRLIGMPVGERLEAFGKAMAVAFTGGREAELRGRPEFYERVIFVLDLDPATGFEVSEEDIGELDRLSRPRGLVPEVEIVVLPLSALESMAGGSGIESFAASMHFDLEGPRFALADSRHRFETLLAERFLEQQLLDRLSHDRSEETSSRRPWRDRIGIVRRESETWRFALRDHESGKELRPLARDTLDLYRYRYPELLGVRPWKDADVSWSVRLVESSEASREYEALARVPEGYRGGPLVLRLPEYLAYRSVVVHVQLQGPGMETSRSIEGYRFGAHFIPEGLGYRLEEKRRETVLHVETIDPGDYRFRVSVVGRRF